MAALMDEQDDYPQIERSSSPSDSHSATSSQKKDRKKKQQQPRQLLSCSKCRERKVKCDRTKPCSACCARGHPKECHFVLGEGTEFGPIQQSLELRKLRAENQRLKERLLLNKMPVSGDSEKEGRTSAAASSSSNRTTQRRFGTDEPTDSLYFGSPGLASIIADFADLQMEPKSLSHTLPRGADMYAPEGSMYPFPTIWDTNTCVQGLFNCLQPWEEVSSYLDSFLARSESRAWPRLAQEITKKEVERYLADFERNTLAYPDMLALIFAALATGLQTGIHERSGEQWIGGAVSSLSRKGDLFVAATMQALRRASFMNQPTLLSIQALMLLGPHLTNSGRFLDAWTLFGVTIRSAQSIGLHRNPQVLNPAPSLREAAVRKKLWWWMLHMDQQYSMTLGRPLGISGMGDCPFPEPLTTDPSLLRAADCINHLTVLGRQVLSGAPLVATRTDGLSDKLLGLLDTLPEDMQFNETWARPTAPIPEDPMAELAAVLHCKVHNYLILLNRQRLDTDQSGDGWPSDVRRPSLPRLPSTSSPLTPLITVNQQTAAQALRGRAQVIKSCVALLFAFEFFYKRLPAELIDWTIGQQAFNACMILLLDMHETRDLRHQPRTDCAFAIFRDLDEKGVHMLAKLAVTRISREMVRLRNAREQWASASTLSSSPVDTRTEIQTRGSGSVQTLSRRPSGPFLAIQRRVSGPVPTSQNQSFHSIMEDIDRPGHDKDTVMGNTGMFLLEDAGLQAMAAPTFSERRDSVPYIPYSPQHVPQLSLQQQQQNDAKHMAGLQSNTFGLAQQESYSQPAPPFAVGLQPRIYQQQNPAMTMMGTPTQGQGGEQFRRGMAAQQQFAQMLQYPPTTTMG